MMIPMKPITAASRADDLYPSRCNAQPAMLERKDPVVYPGYEEAGPLTQDQINFFDQNGYLFLEQFFSVQETEQLRKDLDIVLEKSRNSTRPEVVTEPGSDEVRSVFAVHRDEAAFRALSRDDRLTGAVKQILGSRIYIHQSRINFKPGFHGKEFYWHSDFETWHVEDGMPRMRALSCSILLEPNMGQNGPLIVIPGSHKTFVSCVGAAPENHYKQSLRKQEFGVPDHESLRKLVQQKGLETPVGPAGSVLMFDCNIMHGSNSNITPFSRSNVFFVYNSVENQLAEPFSGTEPRPEFLAHREYVEVI